MINRMQSPLYRNPQKGKIFGVCAGVAESFGWECWIVRAVTLFVGFLTGFGPVILAYMVAFFILDPKPSDKHAKPDQSGESEACDSRFRQRVKEARSTFSKTKEPCSEILDKIEVSLMSTQDKVEKIEAFVTSGRYDLDREFRKMGNSA